jgi:hypothetical protein
MVHQEDWVVEVRAILKKKALSGEFTVDMAKMMSHYKKGEAELLAVISQYESELIATNFEVINTP